MTPGQVHYGQTDAVHAARQVTLTTAFHESRAFRQQAADTVRQTDRRLDQPANPKAP